MHPEDIAPSALDEPMPAPPIEPERAIVSAVERLPVKEGEHREASLVIAEESPFASSTIRKASVIAYTGVSGLVLLIVAASFVTLLVWFISDLRNIGSLPIPSGIDHSTFVRNQVISAVINLLANLVLVFILIEVFTAIVNFVRTRRATARPLLLIPLYIIMRAIVVIGGQLVFNPPPNDTQVFIEVLAELVVFSLVGLALSIALAVLRDPNPPKTQG
jgi:hypothetical protein